MSSLEAKRLYYDTNTGLMPIIQALIAPPVSEEDAETERRAKREKREKKVEKKEGLDLHPYYKKRGKSHNHDYCDACLEGGNLLCCDTCEASFHLECNDPPLHVDEIPLDMWQCRRCTKLHKESPSKKGSPGKNSKRRKSNNSNTSSTSTNNYKKLKTSHGQESEEEGFARPPNKDNHYNNHGGGGANDSGDSDISSVSTTRRRGRPRKYPLPTPVRAKTNNKGNLSDSDTESVQENRSKRFMKRRKKEPPKNNTTPPGDSKSQNPADGDQSTSSDEGPLQTGERDRLTASGSSTINNNFGKNRSLPNAVASSREVPTPRISSVYRGDSSHIGYLKYSSSDDEDSHSEKSLYFRDMVLQGSKPLTEEYLDENTGEIMTRSLCENEYLSKLLSKKNTTSEIDDIERINELLLKTKNMAMDPNIIKKIIGCSIPEQSDGSDENGNAYDSDEDERTSEEDAGVEERSYPPASSNDQQAQPINSTSTLPGISKDISEDATLSGQSKDIPESGNKQSKDISNVSSRPSGSSSNVNSSNSNEAVEQIATVPSNIELSKPSSQSSNDSSNSVPATPSVSDPISTQQDMGQPQPTTKDGLKSTNPTEGGEQDEEMEEEEEKSDEELASLRKFSALWREKFGEEEGSGEEEEEEESGRESETSEEWEEEGEEGKTLAPAEPMDFQAERAVHTEASCVDPDQPDNKSSTEEITEEGRKFQALSVDEDGKAQESNKTEPKEKKALSSLLEEDAVESSLDDIQIDWSDKSNEVEVRNAMQILLSAVALSNPEQFSLGKFEDKSYDKYVWPGTDKIPDTARLSSKRARALMNVTELDGDGLVPAPLRLCHACGRACGRRAPLLGCDYCPLAYHLDCLEPPLASVPTLTWLCPAHPTALLDRVLGAAEGGVVERGEVWDAWATRPVSEEQVTREFLSKVRSQSQRHRIKRSRIPAKIPGFVSFHYQRPPELAPSLQEALHLQAVAERERGEERGASREEKEQFLRSLIALETQLLRLSYENKSSSLPTTASSSDTKLKASSSTAEQESEPTKLKLEDDEKAEEESSPSEKSILENQLESAATKPTDKKETSDTRVDSAATIRVEVNGDLVTTVVEMDSQEVLGSMHDSADKLDSYFRFGEDFLTPPPPPSSAHNVTMSTVNNFKLDDINPNNFKVEDLFITTTLPLNNSDESFILDKSEDACIEEDKSIEEEIVSLDEVKEDLLDEKEVKEEEERIGWEEKEKEEVKEEVLEVKVEEEENKVEEKAEVNMKRSLFVQLNELLRNAKLPADDKTGAIIDLSDIQQLNPDLVQVLALERLSQLVVSDTPSLLPQPHLSHPYAPFVPRRSAPPSRLHAQLCPLSRKLGPVPMTSNWMTIGLGPNSTVDLSRFGFCSRVSAQHAVIFYEMASNTYELVNTSEFGTRVDSLLYTLDTSLPASSSSHHHHHRHAPSLSSAHQARLKFRAAASERIKQDAFTWDARAGRMRTREGMERRKKRRRRRVLMEGQEEEERLPLHYGETIYKCACLADEKSEKEEDSADTSSSSRKASSQGGGGKQHSSSAWESTCLVRHGSLLQFGCFKFVFSVTEHTRPLPPPYDTLSHRRASQLTTAELPNPGAATATATGETGVVTGDEASAALQEGGKQASVEGGKQASVEGGKQASVEAGKQASARLASSAGDVGEQHKPAPCQNKSASSKQGKEFKPTRRKTAGTKVKRRGGSSANAKHSAGSSTDTCSESEEYDAEKD